MYYAWPTLEPESDQCQDTVDTVVHCQILVGKRPKGSGSGINSRPLLCYRVLNRRLEETTNNLLLHNSPFLPYTVMLSGLSKTFFEGNKKYTLTLYIVKIFDRHCPSRGGSNSGLSVPSSFPKQCPFPSIHPPLERIFLISR